MKSIGALVVVALVGLLSTPAVAALDAGPPSEDAGSGACHTNDDCYPPKAYCSPTLGVCVQCIADLNCFGVAYVCNQEKGVCATCRTSNDCYGSTPYCSTAVDRCVECVTDANCGTKGIHCKDGTCGSCGDGVCSDNELAGMFGLCVDCLAGCGGTDLHSRVGSKIVSGTLPITGGEQFTTACGPPFAPEATYTWTSPADATYLFDPGPSVFISVLTDNCAGPPLQCSGPPTAVFLSKGQKVVLLVSPVSAGATADYAINVTATQACNAMLCNPGPNGESPCCLPSQQCGAMAPFGCVDPSTIITQPGSPTACLDAAMMNGEAICPDATECSCKACPNAHLGCSTTTGCNAIVACFDRFGCSGMDCYTPDRCMALIDANGGPSGNAFAAGVNNASCALRLGCRLACPTTFADASVGGGMGGSSGGGGRGSGGRAASAGAAGSPRQSSSGGQDGGLDARSRSTTTTGGCGCTVPSGRTPPWSALAALAALSAAVVRRRGAHAGRERASLPDGKRRPERR